jgi:hypothetical protein
MCRDCTEICPWSGPQEVDFLRHFSSELLECRDSHFPKLNKKRNKLDGQYSIKLQLQYEINSPLSKLTANSGLRFFARDNFFNNNNNNNNNDINNFPE